jgi:carbonic anhydrase
MTSTLELIAGFRRFREKHFTHDDALYRQLVEQGQMPKILVVACCDSRVDPAIVLDCAPGDLFVIRNVANLVPPLESRVGHHGTSAALEFGVCNLGVQHVIVLGHAHCGGIQALMRDDGNRETASFIGDWVRLVEGVRSEVERDLSAASPRERQRNCEQRAILVSLENLMTFPWVRERVESGTLFLHGWYFDIEQGQLLGYNADRGAFESL